MASNYEILLDRLDRFIRRYYLNLLLKGALLFGAGFLILFLAFSVFEYIGFFNSTIRFVLFYGFVVFNLLVFIGFVLRPLAGMLKIGKRISESDAAAIIGMHFKTELHDKITNAIQLKDYLQANPAESDLVMAGIEQKSKLALDIPFSNAINLRGNLKYLPFFLLPLIVFGGMMLIRPSMVVEPANRIVRYQTHFVRQAPFEFIFNNELSAFQGQNFTLSINSQGSVLPSNANIRVGKGLFVMNPAGKGGFSYLFRNLQQTVEFFIESEGFVFGPYRLAVVQKPAFSHFTVKVQNPAYTGLGVQEYLNIGDISVAEGAKITWEFNTRGSGSVSFFINEKEMQANEVGAGIYRLTHTARQSVNYQVFAWNNEIGRGDSLKYFVQVKPDAWPQIQIEEQQDSVLLSHLFFRGVINDDFGFSNLQFYYRLLSQHQKRAGEEVEFSIEKLPVGQKALSHSFFHHFDLSTIGIGPGETMEYFFTVSDNDEINGHKTSRSRLFSLFVPEHEELIANARESSQRHKDELGNEISGVRQSRREIQEIRKQLLISESLNWNQRNAIENLLNRQNASEENFERLQREKEVDQVREAQFSEISEEIREKQEDLNRLYEEVLPDELRNLMEKLREELDKLDRNQVYDMLNQMDFELRNLENQMDRALELFRQLEIEKLLQQSIDMLGKTREQQDQNIQNTGSSPENRDERIENQKDIGKNFEIVSDLLEEFREKNEQLRRPHRIDNTSESEKELSNELNRALEQLEQGRQRQSLQHQQRGSQQMNELGQRLLNMQAQMAQDQLAEDSRALRVILENLLKSSFSQENLLVDVRNINVNDPRFVAMIQEQRKIQEDLRMIEDSLLALSRRQLQIGSFVNREIGEINMNLETGMDDLINRRRFQASSRQQFVMTHINNLALLLNESLQNMQMQMAANSGNPQPGSGQCEGGFPDLRQMQEQLNQMLERMQQGHQPIPGQTGQNQSMSEQLARLAAQQEAIRNMLRGLADEMKKDGQDAAPLDALQREMERTELDIVTRNISGQTLQRQQRILTRLLEHEKAQLEREQEERREGTTAKNYQISNPAEFFEYNSKRNRELEMLRSIPPGLRLFYRLLVENYFLNVE